ncbi:hypothetical protein D1871_11305 [Nakamurella silvestris]|nr:hypothetical protein D1871_11305 [Nakamurella silvestris]
MAEPIKNQHGETVESDTFINAAECLRWGRYATSSVADACRDLPVVLEAVKVQGLVPAGMHLDTDALIDLFEALAELIESAEGGA